MNFSSRQISMSVFFPTFVIITLNALTPLDLMRVVVDQGLLEMDLFALVSFHFEYVIFEFLRFMVHLLLNQSINLKSSRGIEVGLRIRAKSS